MDTYGYIFGALSDPTRRALFETLQREPRCVRDLAAEFPISRPAVSQHLRVLKLAKLVTEQRRGTQRIYRVNPEGLHALRSYVDQMWDDALDAFRTHAEQEADNND